MPQLRIAILQTPAPDFMEQDAAWRTWVQRIDDAARDELDLIVLPEASYPAWFLADAATSAPSIADWQLIRDLAERARRHHVHIAAGLVLGRPDAPVNAAILLDPQGVEVARATEGNPARWFHAGQGPAMTSVAGVSCTLVAGNDLQHPRWSQAAPIEDTSIVISTGAPRGTMRGDANASHVSAAILASRAIEAGAWVISAGRTGVEAEAVSYLGGAGIVSPEGHWVVRAPADRPGIVLHTIDVTPSIRTRRAEMARTSDQHISSFTRHQTIELEVAALALDPNPSVVDLMESVRASVRAAATLGAQVVVLPDLTGDDPRAVTQDEVLPLIEAVSAETSTVVIATLAERAGGILYRTISLVEQGRLLETHRQASLSDTDRRAGFTAGSETPPVVTTTSAGRIGLLAGREALNTQGAASLQRRGAQLIAWSTGDSALAIDAVALTRAWEHRLPLVAASSARCGAYVIEAGGHPLAASHAGQPMLVTAPISLR